MAGVLLGPMNETFGFTDPAAKGADYKTPGALSF